MYNATYGHSRIQMLATSSRIPTACWRIKKNAVEPDGTAYDLSRIARRTAGLVLTRVA
jgi:hypothetical protein